MSDLTSRFLLASYWKSLAEKLDEKYLAHGNIYHSKAEAKDLGLSRNPLNINKNIYVIVSNNNEAKELCEETIKIYSRLIEYCNHGDYYFIQWHRPYRIVVTYFIPKGVRPRYVISRDQVMSAATYKREVLQ